MSGIPGYVKRQVKNVDVKPGDLIWVCGAGMHCPILHIRHCQDGATEIVTEHTSWGRARRNTIRRATSGASAVYVRTEPAASNTGGSR